MKKFFGEFKKFITRGNVLDMAVGVIVGSAFTAIVTALSNNILKPIINWLLALIFGSSSLTDVFTYLKKVEGADGLVDLTQSIYIDWGAFINAIINFLLIAFVLFIIVRTINNLQDGHKKLKKEKLTKEEKKELKARGIKRHDFKAIEAYREEKKALEAQAQAEADAKAKAEAEEAFKNSTEGLLKQIKELLEKQAK